MHTQRMPHEHEGRDQGDMSRSPETTKITSKPPEVQGEAWTRSSIRDPRSQPANILMSDFQLPEPFKPPSLLYFVLYSPSK